MGDQTALLARQQDEELGRLGAGVKRVKALAGLMRDELHEQDVILETLEEDVERTDSAMKSMSTRMGGLIEQAKGSDRALWTTIVVLSLLLAFLVYQVLS
ncbi:hypothetical protein AB1Y20_007306 [Prymnesium parvum]|uniref:t-SNARE coiled-coil homology domain-containing protein n=1 Tax=Prymnesium parvum TaxID=97485 RepID=A0AB34IXQ4_PRYPA